MKKLKSAFYLFAAALMTFIDEVLFISTSLDWEC